MLEGFNKVRMTNEAHGSIKLLTQNMSNDTTRKAKLKIREPWKSLSWMCYHWVKGLRENTNKEFVPTQGIITDLWKSLVSKAIMKLSYHDPL